MSSSTCSVIVGQMLWDMTQLSSSPPSFHSLGKDQRGHVVDNRDLFMPVQLVLPPLGPGERQQ